MCEKLSATKPLPATQTGVPTAQYDVGEATKILLLCAKPEPGFEWLGPRFYSYGKIIGITVSVYDKDYKKSNNLTVRYVYDIKE
jgi:hypothetical protein